MMGSSKGEEGPSKNDLTLGIEKLLGVMKLSLFMVLTDLYVILVTQFFFNLIRK